MTKKLDAIRESMALSIIKTGGITGRVNTLAQGAGSNAGREAARAFLGEAKSILSSGVQNSINTLKANRVPIIAGGLGVLGLGGGLLAMIDNARQKALARRIAEAIANSQQGIE